MRYWALANKLELLNQGQNPDKLNQKQKIILWSGIAVTLVIGVLSMMQGNPVNNKRAVAILNFVKMLCMLVLLISCFVLIDAYRRFRKIQKQNQVINNNQVMALSIAYLSYILSLLISFSSYFVSDGEYDEKFAR